MKEYKHYRLTYTKSDFSTFVQREIRKYFHASERFPIIEKNNIESFVFRILVKWLLKSYSPQYHTHLDVDHMRILFQVLDFKKLPHYKVGKAHFIRRIDKQEIKDLDKREKTNLKRKILKSYTNAKIIGLFPDNGTVISPWTGEATEPWRDKDCVELGRVGDVIEDILERHKYKKDLSQYPFVVHIRWYGTNKEITTHFKKLDFLSIHDWHYPGEAIVLSKSQEDVAYMKLLFSGVNDFKIGVLKNMSDDIKRINAGIKADLEEAGVVL
jgi:hypothetical protein